MTWEQLAQGDSCPFDTPRESSNEYWDIVAQLSVSSLYLSKNQTYRGHCVLVLDLRHAIRAEQLTSEEWASFCVDLHQAQDTIIQTVQPDHINLASLGNVIPHLHWHIIPRYYADPRWGAPIWPTKIEDMADLRLEPSDRIRLIQELRNSLDVGRENMPKRPSGAAA